MHLKDREAMGYVCPYHLSIDREKQTEDAIPATVKFSHSVGPLVYIEMKLQDSEEYVEAEISKEKFTELNLKIGEVVFVRPKEVRIFVPEDFVI
jgi:sulfate transport system ATP-binding protein